MTHAAAALTPQDDTLTTPALLTILALVGLAFVVWLIHKIRRTGRVISESSAVTTRGFELCPTHLRPMRSGRCLQCIPFDQASFDPDFSAWETEIGGEVA